MTDAQRRARWVVHLSREIDRQDLTGEDRRAILCALLGREIARMPPHQAAEALTLIQPQVVAVEQCSRVQMDTALLRAAVPMGRA